MANKITVALAGLGSRGKDTYAKAAKIHPDKIEIVAIADVNPKKSGNGSGGISRSKRKMLYKCRRNVKKKRSLQMRCLLRHRTDSM